MSDNNLEDVDPLVVGGKAGKSLAAGPCLRLQQPASAPVKRAALFDPL